MTNNSRLKYSWRFPYLAGRRFSGFFAYLTVFFDFCLKVFPPRRKVNPFYPPCPKNIVILKLDHLGDFLIATPFIRELRLLFPESNFCIFHNSVTKELINLFAPFFHIHSSYIYDSLILNRGEESQFKNFFSEIKCFCNLLKHSFSNKNSLLIDLRPYSSYLFPIYPFLQYRHLIGFGLRGGSRGLTGNIQFDPGQSTGQSFLNLLNQYDGRQRVYRRPYLPAIKASLPEDVKTFVAKKPFLVVQIGAGSSQRNIRHFRWLDVLSALEPFYFFVILGLQKDTDLSWLTSRISKTRFQSFETSIAESMATVKLSSGVLSVDSFCAHLGLGFNKKTVVLMDSVAGNINSFPSLNNNFFLLEEHNSISDMVSFLRGQIYKKRTSSLYLGTSKFRRKAKKTKQGLCLNGRFLLENRPTGTHRSSHLFFQGLANSWPGPVSLATNSRVEQASCFLEKIQEVTLIDQNISSGWRSHFWEQFVFPFFARGKIQLHGMGTAPFLFSGKKQVMFIHDLNFLILKNTFSSLFCLWYRLACAYSARRSFHIVCFTSYVKKTISETLHIPPDRISVIPQGPGLDETLLALPARLGFSNSFFLCVGSLQPHKNLKAILQAWAMWRHRPPGVELKIIGHPQKNFLGLNIPNDLLGQPDVSFTGYLSDAQLVRHYQHALGFVYPSFEEGFGLPIVESFHAGCPVITSNASCLPEVAGDAALLVHPDRPEEITRALQSLYYNPGLRTSLIKAGRKRAELFSWKLATRKLTDLLLEIAST